MPNNLSNLQIEGINEVNKSLSQAIFNLSKQEDLSENQMQMIYSALQIIEKGYEIQSNLVKGEMHCDEGSEDILTEKESIEHDVPWWKDTIEKEL